MNRAISYGWFLQLTYFFSSSQIFCFTFYLLLLLLPVLLQCQKNVVAEKGSVLSIAQSKRFLLHKVCNLRVKQHKCLEDSHAETIGEQWSQKGMGVILSKLFSVFSKYHSRGKFLSRYLKKSSNFHVAGIRGKILHASSAEWI